MRTPGMPVSLLDVAEEGAIVEPRGVAPVVRHQPSEAEAKDRVVVARVGWRRRAAS